MHRFQDIARARDGIVGPLDQGAVAACRNKHAEPVFDLDQIGVELAEQRAKHGLFVEFDFDPGTAMRIAAMCAVVGCAIMAAGFAVRRAMRL